MKYKVLIGGIVGISVACGFIVFGNSTIETEQVAQTVVELTPLEKLIKEIKESDEFQEEVNMLAKARAMYQLSVIKQDEALALSEQALETYQAAKSFENDWKINQREI